MSTKSEVIHRLVCTKEEARRFITKCNEALESVDVAGREYHRDRKWAAAKRASLDLSEKLADMRRSLYT